MKGLGIGNIQHNIVDLSPGSPTNSGRWSLHSEWMYKHTHTQPLVCSINADQSKDHLFNNILFLKALGS